MKNTTGSAMPRLIQYMKDRMGVIFLALVLAALGLLLLFFAVWFFIRCVVGFVNLILRKGREWCYDHGEVDA